MKRGLEGDMRREREEKEMKERNENLGRERTKIKETWRKEERKDTQEENKER